MPDKELSKEELIEMLETLQQKMRNYEDAKEDYFKFIEESSAQLLPLSEEDENDSTR